MLDGGVCSLSNGVLLLAKKLRETTTLTRTRLQAHKASGSLSAPSVAIAAPSASYSMAKPAGGWVRAGDEPAAAVRRVGRASGPRRGVLAAGLGPVAPGWGAVGRLVPALLALEVVEMDSTM